METEEKCMKQVTLYWDDFTPSKLVYYYDGSSWRCYTIDYQWRKSMTQVWTPEHFQKSITVNNFKEK